MSCSPARRRYNRSVLLCSAGYGFALVGASVYFHDHPDAHSATAYAAAIVPALLIVAIFFTMGRYLVEERDEFVRMLMVRQTLIASALSLSLATVWGFLESFGLATHVAAYWYVVLWFAGLGFGAFINKLTIGREA